MIEVNVRSMLNQYSFAESTYGIKDILMKVQEGATLGDLLKEMAERLGPAFKKNIFDPDKVALCDGWMSRRI